MKNKMLHIPLIALILGAVPASSIGQRINFGLFATDGITLSTTAHDELNFNQKAGVIVPGFEGISIIKTDEESVILEIEARIDLDINVIIDADPFLILLVGEDEHQIPLSVSFAYHNVGLGVFETLPQETIKDQSLEVPAGFNTATFAMRRRTGGPPTPPPTPDHVGHTQPMGKSYLVIYANMGQVPLNAPAGLYEATINVRVEYATYHP